MLVDSREAVRMVLESTERKQGVPSSLHYANNID